MAIPISADIKVIPSVLEAAGSAIDLNGAVLTNDQYAPMGQLLTFTSAKDVSDYFGALSDEYSMAEVYFQGYDNSSVTPRTLYFFGYATEARSAFVRSGSLESLTLQRLQSIKGNLSLNVDNVKVSSSIDLSEVTSLTQAAETIESAFDGIEVVYNTDIKSLVISSTTVGKDSQLSVEDGEVAQALLLTSATGGQESIGSDESTADSALSALQEKTTDFVTFSTAFECTMYEHTQFAGWAALQNDRYAYVGWSQDGTEVTSGSTETFAYQVIETYAYENTVPVYGDQAHAAGVMGYAASLNFDLTNGRRSLKFRSQQGLIPLANTLKEHDALTTNGYNFYGQYAENKLSATYWAQGTITGSWAWLDTFLGQVWFNTNLQSAIVTLFRSEIYLPYSTRGKTAIEAACSDVINQFKNWGGLSEGVQITAAQNQVITAITGRDVSSTLFSQGYYMYVGDFTAQMRKERTTPVVYIWYMDASCLHELTINSVEVQ